MRLAVKDKERPTTGRQKRLAQAYKDKPTTGRQKIFDFHTQRDKDVTSSERQKVGLSQADTMGLAEEDKKSACDKR